MQAMDDMTLLREYAARGSEAAFGELVSRRVGFVYSTALRQVRDPHLAEEITQVVFVILAQKARKISDKTVMTGWLFKTTRYAALAQLRDHAKHRQRELEVQMQTELQPAAADSLWEQMSPMLDEALTTLGETDRQAVLLRFFENKSLAEVGSHLGTGEDTARKRVSRALEKLRKYFSKRGVVSTTAILGGTISANSVHAAPTGLATTIAAAAVKGPAVAVSTLTLVKGTLKLMTMAKLKIAALIGAAIILATGTTVVVNRVVAQDSSVDDSAWARMDTRILDTLPPAFVLRPTHFANPDAGFGGGMAKAGNKMLGRAVSFDALMSLAYGVDVSRVVSPSDKPAGLYDLLITTPDASSERLQAEIKRQLGYVAHRESRQTDVFLLELKQPNAPGLRPSQGRNGGGGGMASSASSSSAGTTVKKRSINSQNQPIPILIKNLQGYFDKPILDRTGLTGNFDVSLEITTGNGDSESDAIKRALPVQLGLDLVLGSELIETLIVERAKN